MLYFYLAVFQWARRSVLVRKVLGVQFPVYYTSKALLDKKIRDPMMEE